MEGGKTAPNGRKEEVSLWKVVNIRAFFVFAVKFPIYSLVEWVVFAHINALILINNCELRVLGIA